MTQLFFIPLFIVLGLALRYVKVLPKNLPQLINWWIINIALPAVSIKHLLPMRLSYNLLVPALGPLLAVISAFVCIAVLAKLVKLDAADRKLLLLVSGLCNTSFIGFPLVIAYFGQQALSTAVICDQVTFLLFSTLALYSVIGQTEEKTGVCTLISRVLKFPPFIACILALCLPYNLPMGGADAVLSFLTGSLAPLALITIGLQLKFTIKAHDQALMLYALVLKLILVPACVLLFFKALHISGLPTTITVFESAMPTLLSLSILAQRYNYRTQLLAGITSISILVSFISTFFWQLLLTSLV